MTLSGCGTALVTPFRGDGSLDEETLSKLVEWQIERHSFPGRLRNHRRNADPES
jgi:hypothetical protein